MNDGNQKQNYNNMSQNNDAAKTPAPNNETPTPKVEKKETVIVLAHRLYVRIKPAPKTGRVAIVKRGDKLEAIGTEGDWVKVTTSDKQIGWVAKEFVKEV